MWYKPDFVSGSGAADVFPIAFAVNDNAFVLVSCCIPNTSGTAIKPPSAAKKVQNWGEKSFLCLPVLVNSSDPLMSIKFSAFVSSVTLLYIQLCMYTDTHPHTLNPMDCPNHFPFILQPHLHFQLWETALLSWGKVRASVCKCGKMKVQHLTQLGRSWGEQEKPFQHPCYVQE